MILDTAPAEQTELHTRILRLALAIDESRAYWERVDPGVPLAARAERAFEERWFGGKSLDRVRLLIANFAARYDAYPGALEVLRGWARMDGVTRALVCHVHLQLSDPLYRAFTGEYLVSRRTTLGPPGMRSSVSRDLVVRWVDEREPGRWAPATVVQFASKLMSAAAEAGLLEGARDPRPLVLPRVPDVALSYVLHLLREVRFEGTLFHNPYLASLGLSGERLDARLHALPGVRHRRMGDLHELDWAAPSLAQWAEALA